MTVPGSNYTGLHYNKDSNREELYFRGTLAGYWNASGIFSAAATALGSTADNALFTLGTDTDIAMVSRSTVLNANTALTGVIVGTPVTPAVAANSLIIGNVTADGDILLATQTGGNTYANMWVDASASLVRFYAAAGIEVLKLGSAAVTVTGTLTATGLVTGNSGATVPATAGAVAAGAAMQLFSNGPKLWTTSDAPTFSATKGDICINTGGSSSSTRLYVNNGTTTWVAITTAS